MSLLGVDIGTTGVKAQRFCEEGALLKTAYRPYPAIHLDDGGLELDPAQMWRRTKDCIREASAGAIRDPVKAFAFSVLGDAIMPVDAKGRPLSRLMVGQGKRTVGVFRRFERKVGRGRWFRRTGLAPSSNIGLPWWMWWRRHSPDLHRKTWKFFYFGNYIQCRLGIKPSLDASHACHSGALSLTTHDWDDPLLAAAGVDRDKLPALQPSGEVLGHLDAQRVRELGLPPGVALVAGGADQLVSALGAGVICSGQAINSLGTYDCVGVVTGEARPSAALLNGHYSHYRHVLPNRFVVYAYRATGASLVNWFLKQVNGHARLAARFFQTMPDRPTDLFVLPFFTGSGTPWLDSRDRGAILGLTLSATNGELGRALIEGMAFDSRLNLERLRRAGLPVRECIATGGGSQSPRWVQIKADVMGIPFRRLQNPQAGCLGAAILAGIGIGSFRNLEEGVAAMVRVAEIITPSPQAHRFYTDRFARYCKICEKVRKLVQTR